MPIRNITAPLNRCRNDTNPGNGRRIATRLRYTGRGLATGRVDPDMSDLANGW
jgi:hypothetical protein